MANESTKNNLENIRSQINFLKQRLDTIDKTLDTQEEALNVLYENSKSLLSEALNFNNNNPIEEIMKKVFSKGRLPKIFFK